MSEGTSPSGLPAATGARRVRTDEADADCAALGIRPAPPLRRSLALVIDVLILAVAVAPAVVGALPILGGRGGDPVSIGSPAGRLALICGIVSAALILVIALVQGILHGARGITFGKAMTGLRTVRATTLASPGFWRVVARFALFVASGVVPLVGPPLILLSPLWDPGHRGRGWTDRATRTLLVDTRRGLDPRDAKALRLARRAAEKAPVEAPRTLPSLATAASGVAVAFLPADRSRSGVVAAADAGVLGSWTPPEISTAPDTAEAEPPHLVLDDGSRMAIAGRMLIGRDPEASPGEQIDRLLAVTDDTRQMSKTHLALELADGVLLATDRGSVNGVTVATEHGARRALQPFEPTAVGWRDRVEVGGRTMRFERSEESA